MRLTSLLTAIIIASVPAVRAVSITGYSGDKCDGGVGNNVACDGSCHSFTGRHSFKVAAGGKAAGCVAVFTAPGCGGQKNTFSGQRGGCTNVNTGMQADSFRCYSGGCP